MMKLIVLVAFSLVLIGCAADTERAKARGDVQRMAAKACIDKGGVIITNLNGEYKDCKWK